MLCLPCFLLLRPPRRLGVPVVASPCAPPLPPRPLRPPFPPLRPLPPRPLPPLPPRWGACAPSADAPRDGLSPEPAGRTATTRAGTCGGAGEGAGAPAPAAGAGRLRGEPAAGSDLRRIFGAPVPQGLTAGAGGTVTHDNACGEGCTAPAPVAGKGACTYVSRVSGEVSRSGLWARGGAWFHEATSSHTGAHTATQPHTHLPPCHHVCPFCRDASLAGLHHAPCA